MKQLIFILLLILICPFEVIADNQLANSFLNGVIAGVNQQMTGEPASNYLNNFQQQQQLAQQQQYNSQLLEQQRLQNDLIRQQIQQQQFQILNQPQAQSRRRSSINCTTIGSGGLYNTNCR